MLKEGDLRIGFTPLFKSPTPHEILPREILQRRLLLCLFGLGTNAGIKRVASGSQTENYRDLLYVLHRYINKDGLRAAIAELSGTSAIAGLGLWSTSMLRKRHCVFIHRSNAAPHRR
jgi:hypothetical protein